MGACCSQQTIQTNEQPVSSIHPIQSETPLETPLALPTPVPMEYVRNFWATPVFLSNSTLPRADDVYIQVYPVEPFRAQRYTIRRIVR
jgi:hypothetical protein